MIKKGLGWMYLVFAACCPTSALAHPAVTDCRVLLNYIHQNYSESGHLFHIDEAQITNLEPQRLQRYEPHVVWNLQGPQNASHFEKQLHAILDMMIDQSVAASTTPNLLVDYPNLYSHINAVKNHISLWVRAFTDDQTGFISFAKAANRAASSEFRHLETESQKELAYASEGLTFGSAQPFIKLNPIPHFTIGGVSINWLLQILPNPKNRGFHIFVHSLHPNSELLPRMQNRIFLGSLRDSVFGETGRPMPPTHNYQFVSAKQAGVHSALDFFNALSELGEIGASRVNVDQAARKLVIEVNLRMMKYFCQVAKLCGKLNLDFAHQFSKIDSVREKTMRLAHGGYYDFNQYESFFDEVFRYTIGLSYKKNHFRTHTFMGWKDFKEFAKTYTKDFDENAWNLAILEFTTSHNGPIRENAIVLFDRQDTMLEDYIRADLINIQYLIRADLFASKLTLAHLPIEQLKFQIKPSAQAYGDSELQAAHLKLVLGRINQLFLQTPK